ncbi:MAG TPA: ABC transporter ATP-binding protein [Acidimicrobiia bacterium]|nr:ABC transporter ATP-binding protein [Acidimicrobiia bacterium]
MRPYRRALVVVGFAALVGLIASTAIPLITKAVIDGPVTDGDRAGIAALAGLALLFGILEAISGFIRRNVLGVIAHGVETQLRNDLYAHLQRLDVGFHDDWDSGQLLSRATSDIAAIRRFVGWGAIFFVINGVTAIVVLILLARLNAPLVLLVVVMAVPLIFILRVLQRRYSEASRKVQDDQGDLATLVEEGATGIRAIKSFGRRAFVSKRFDNQANVLYDSSMARVRLIIHFEWALNVLPGLALAGVLLFGAFAVGDGSMTLGGLVAFVSYLLMIIWPIESLGWILGMAEEAATAAERVFEVFDCEPRVQDAPGARELGDVAGSVRFEGVGFRYPGYGERVLRDVNLEIEPGETLALVGLTGSGKTTLAMLVPRLYDVSTGRVTIDGVDVRDATLRSLRRQVAVGFEEATLFSASVRENVTLGNAGATDQDVEDALLVAQAQFVHDLPWGLDTRIGEQGMTLSGGQRQRIALARAILAEPHVIVLDDPLSALDVHTEKLVERALRRVLHGVTALIVVHRPSTVALAHRAALLWDGTVAAVGTHTELLADERYKAILSQEADELEDLSDEIDDVDVEEVGVA